MQKNPSILGGHDESSTKQEKTALQPALDYALNRANVRVEAVTESSFSHLASAAKYFSMMLMIAASVPETAKAEESAMEPVDIIGSKTSTASQEYTPTGFIRFGMQGLSTTKSTSETGDSLVIGLNLPAYPSSPDWLGVPSAQLNIGLTGSNGTEIDLQVNQGVTLPLVEDRLDVSASASLGVEVFAVGLDDPATTKGIVRPYAIGSAALNLRIPLGAATLNIAPGAGVKAHLGNPINFPGEDGSRTRLQPTLDLGVSVKAPIGKSSIEAGAYTHLYLTDRGEGHRIWQDLAATLNW